MKLHKLFTLSHLIKIKDFIWPTKCVTSNFINFKSRELITSIEKKEEEKVGRINVKLLRWYHQNDGYAEIAKDVGEKIYFFGNKNQYPF